MKYFNPLKEPILQSMEVSHPAVRYFPDCNSTQFLTMDTVKILKALKIEPTDARKILLNLVFSAGEEFTIEEICKAKNKKKLPVSDTAMSSNLRLFQARGLIIQSGVKRTEHRGRPVLLFSIALGYKKF